MRRERDIAPDCGLITLFIDQHQDLDFQLTTNTAKRLFQRGAQLYMMPDGTTNVLSLRRPRGAFFKAISLSVMQPPRRLA